MAKFPLRFTVQAASPSRVDTRWTATAGDLSPLPCAIPHEFGGPGGGYSPEDLLALAVLNCMIATYKVYCVRAKVHFEEIVGKASLVVDMQEGKLAMPQIDVEFQVTGASDPEQARKVLDQAIRDCAVSQAIKSQKTFNISIN